MNVNDFFCFLFLIYKTDSGVITRHQADESHPNFYDPDSPALLALLASPQPNRAGGTTVGVAAAPSSPVVVRQMSEDKYLDLEELEKAVLDLGIYPSHEEIENMHNALCVDHPRKYADLEEFLDMVRVTVIASAFGLLAATCHVSVVSGDRFQPQVSMRTLGSSVKISEYRHTSKEGVIPAFLQVLRRWQTTFACSTGAVDGV